MAMGGFGGAGGPGMGGNSLFAPVSKPDFAMPGLGGGISTMHAPEGGGNILTGAGLGAPPAGMDPVMAPITGAADGASGGAAGVGGGPEMVGLAGGGLGGGLAGGASSAGVVPPLSTPQILRTILMSHKNQPDPFNSAPTEY